MGIFRNILGKSRPASSNYQPDFSSKTDLSQVPIIFGWVFNTDPEISRNCAETIHRVLTSYTTFKDKSLYNSLRHIQLHKQQLAKFYEFDVEVQNSLFCIASMNNDGYVREKSLKFLIKTPTQKTFPFILFRLADWVPIIRQIAKNGIRRLIHEQDPQFLISHHKIIDGLLKVERTQLQEIHQEITEFIFSKENTDQVLQNIDVYDEGSRYFIFKNLISRGKAKNQILDKVLADKNYLIRLLAIRHIDLTQRPETLRVLLNDKSQNIRRYAIYEIPEIQLEEFQSELNRLLFDRSTAIRDISRNLLSKIGEQDFVKRYREQVDRKPTTGSIIGLSEVGDKTAIDKLSTYLKSDSPKHRAAALYALSNLDYDAAKKHAFQLLKDSSNSVKKACLQIIPEWRTSDDLLLLRSVYNDGSYETKRFVLKTISKYGGWNIAGDFLKGIKEKDRKINQTAFLFLKAWYTYSIRLGTKQTEKDRSYVMEIYEDLDLKKSEIPHDIKRIIDEIPFIFQE